jgi:hypothetical protein
MEDNTTAANAFSELYAQFPQEMEKVRVVAGVELVYLPVSEVINRLNRVLGVDGWSFEIISVQRDQSEQDEIIAHVSLTAWIGSRQIVKHGFGGQTIKRSKKDGKPVDLGNDFKGAVSDALKKAAQLLGVGLYLARSSDALDAEEAIAASADLPAQITATPAGDESGASWANFIKTVATLSPEAKEQLNVFWHEHSGGKPKPTKSTATAEDVQALLAEAIRLQFSGSYE